MSRSKLPRQWSDKPKGSACRPIFQHFVKSIPKCNVSASSIGFSFPRANERSELENKVLSHYESIAGREKTVTRLRQVRSPRILADAKIKARARVLEVDFFLYLR